MQTVSLSLFRFATPGARLWAFSQMLLARAPLRRLPGIGFFRLCGSGTGEGFTPVPNASVYGVLAVWPSLPHAREQIETAAVYRRYRAQAEEHCALYLAPTASRGRWGGEEPFSVEAAQPEGPIAALTRATLRPRIAAQFWRRVPDISAAIGADPNVAFKIGLGEAPWVKQITFSVWPDAASMAAFARAEGPHARAIRAVRNGSWFAEELYARFEILASEGLWEGAEPLAKLRRTVEPEQQDTKARSAA